MKTYFEVRPINSMLFIHGTPEIAPQPIWGARILATNSCLSTICFPEVDGPTRIDLGGLAEIESKVEPDFSGVIRTATPDLIISTVDKEVLSRFPTAAGLREIKVWLSHPRWPDVVTIGLGELLTRAELAGLMILPDDATQSGWYPVDNCSSLFVADGGIPKTQRDFNPYASPAVLAAGRFIPIKNGIMQVRLLTALPSDTSQLPNLNTTIETPSKNLWIFDDKGKVLFKIDVSSDRTRLLIWSNASHKCSIVVKPA